MRRIAIVSLLLVAAPALAQVPPRAPWCGRFDSPTKLLAIRGAPGGGRAVALADAACIDRKGGILCRTEARGRAVYLDAVIYEATTPPAIVDHLAERCRGEQEFDNSQCRFPVRMTVYTAHDEEAGGRISHYLMGRSIDIQPRSCAEP